MDALLNHCRDKPIFVVEDAAHAFGSSSSGRMVGSFGDLTCFSFDPIKSITCGEGGAIALSDGERARVLRRQRMAGIDRDSWCRVKILDGADYDVTMQGYRYHMSNINAAIGLMQLERLDEFRLRRRAIARRYNEGLSGIDGVKILEWNLEQTCPFMYVLRVLAGRRAALRSFLADRGVSTGIHYTPNHQQPLWANLPGADTLQSTEALAREIVTIPLYYEMTDSDVDRVIAGVNLFFRGSMD
jgi:perosamine synthetase